MTVPDAPYTVAVGMDEDARDVEFRRRLRAAYAARFAEMDRAEMERLLVDVAEALTSLGSTFSGDPRDWGEYRRDAWAYGVVCGWEDAMKGVARKHGWSESLVDRLRRHARAVRKATKHPYLWEDVRPVSPVTPRHEDAE